MAVVIEDMEMPKCCAECPFFDEEGDYPTCSITHYSCGYNFLKNEKIMNFCPLKETDYR